MNLVNACLNGDLDRVKRVLHNIDTSAYYYNRAIKVACRQGHVKIVEALLQDGRADPSDYENNSIRGACTHGHIDIVKLLLQDERVDPTDAANDAIKWASFYGHVKVVEALLQDGRVDPTATYNWAIEYAKTQEIKDMLIRYKYRVDGPEYCKMKSDLASLDRFKN
jgi:hypothetical protein